MACLYLTLGNIFSFVGCFTSCWEQSLSQGTQLVRGQLSSLWNLLAGEAHSQVLG